MFLTSEQISKIVSSVAGVCCVESVESVDNFGNQQILHLYKIKVNVQTGYDPVEVKFRLEKAFSEKNLGHLVKIETGYHTMSDRKASDLWQVLQGNFQQLGLGQEDFNQIVLKLYGSNLGLESNKPDSIEEILRKIKQMKDVVDVKISKKEDQNSKFLVSLTVNSTYEKSLADDIKNLFPIGVILDFVFEYADSKEKQKTISSEGITIDIESLD